MLAPFPNSESAREGAEALPTLALVRLAHQTVALAVAGEKPLHLAPDFVLAWLNRYGYVVELLSDDGSLEYELTPRARHAMTLAQS